jgi:mersacidin/lichenicidin family type 2 lantibiotic
MNIEDIIRAWKADEDDQKAHFAANPVGQELADQELQEVLGGFFCLATCAPAGTVGCLASCFDGTVPMP